VAKYFKPSEFACPDCYLSSVDPRLVQVTCDSHLQRKLDEFARYPIPHEFALKLIVQAKKKKSKWNFFIFEVIGKSYVPVSRELIKSIFSEPLFWELEHKLWYLEKMEA